MSNSTNRPPLMNPEVEGQLSDQDTDFSNKTFDASRVTPAPPPPPEGQVETSLDRLERPQATWIWMKDSGGYPSVSVTMLTVSFWVTTVLFVLSSVQQIGPVVIRPFDVGASGAYFGAILALYFGRRYTDAKFNVNR